MKVQEDPQAGFSDHGAPSALDEPVVAFLGPRDSLWLRLGRRFGHTGQQRMGTNQPRLRPSSWIGVEVLHQEAGNAQHANPVVGGRIFGGAFLAVETRVGNQPAAAGIGVG